MLLKDKLKKIINKYENFTARIETEFYEVWNIRNFYRIRRPEYIGTTMLGMSIISMFIPMIVFLIYMSFNRDKAHLIGYVMLIGILFGCVVLAPIVNLRQRGKMKKYNYLIKGKSREQIVIDDFTNYNQRLEMTNLVHINSKIIDKLESEIQNIEDREALLSKIQEEYTIIPKEQTITPNNEQEIKELNLLYKSYQEQFKNKIKELAIVNFFEKMFKRDWMTDCMNGMMIGMVTMMMCSLPIIMRNSSETAPKNEASILGLLITVLIPMLIGFASPFIANAIERHRLGKAFKTILNEFTESVDTNLNTHEAKENAANAVNDLIDKIVLTSIKLDTINET